MAHPQGYLGIGGDYSYAPLRAGLVLRAPNGKEVYFQPGDDEAAIRSEIEALDELSCDILSGHITEEKHSDICDLALGEYFA